MRIVEEKNRKVQPYNFKRPDRISKNQLRSLHFIHDRFARNFSSSVSAYLRTVVEVTLDDTAQVSYSEFLSRASDPTCYCSIKLKPLEGFAAIEIEPDIIFPLIDRLLGGEGVPIETVRRMTEIEQSIVLTVMRLIADNLKESWRPVYPLDFGVGSIETHPHLVQVIAPNEMVIYFRFNIRMRDTLSKMHFAIPMLVLEPIMHLFDQEFYSKKKIVSDPTLLAQLRITSVPVSIETADAMFPMNSLLTLQVGDTILLDQREEWPLQIKVAGKPKLTAIPKHDARKRTFEISGLHRNFREEKNGSGTN
jgi:flagellar motor switch protein FliM